MTETKTTAKENQMDPLATMTPTEYQLIKAELETLNLWETGGDPVKEHRANAAAEWMLMGLRNR